MEDVMQHYSTNGGFSRRTVLAGAAGALALTSNEAAAQRCPEPPHAKGPRVWLDMDQKELDDAYDQSVYAPNRDQMSKRRASNSELVRARLGAPKRVAYGTTPTEMLDIYPTKTPNAPVAVFVHGGAWRGNYARDSAYGAETLVRAGAHFVVLDFINVTETGGDLMPMTAQIRRGVAWTAKNAASFGGD